MNDSRDEIVPLPEHLKRTYVPGHQVTKNYVKGMTAIEQNRLDAAIAILEAEPINSPCRGLAIGNAGLALLRLEKFEQAFKRLLEADDHFNEHGCPHPPSWVQFARNHVEAIALSRPQEALQCFNRAIASARELAKRHADFCQDIELEIAHIFNSWGGTLVQLGSPDAALDCFDEARDIYRKYESGNKVGLAETLTNASLAFRCIGKKTEAALALQEALDVAKSGGDQDQIRRIEVATIQLDPALIKGDPLLILDNAAKEAITSGRYSTGYVRQCIRAAVAESLGNFDEGLRACYDAKKIEDRLDPTDPSPAQMRILFARLLVASAAPESEVLRALFDGAALWWGLLGQPQLTADILSKTQAMHDHFRFLARKLVDAGRNDEACMAFEAGRALGFAIEVDQSALAKILALNPFVTSGTSVDCKGIQTIQSALLDNEVIISLAILPPDLVAFTIRRDSIGVVTHPLPDGNDSELLFAAIRKILPRLHKKDGILAIPQVIQEFGRKISCAIGNSSVIAVIPNSILHGISWRGLLRFLGMEWSQLSAVTRFGLFVGNPKLAAIRDGTIALGHGFAGAIDLNQEARDFVDAFGDQGSVVQNATSVDLRSALSQRGIILISCHGSQREDMNRGDRVAVFGPEGELGLVGL